MKCLPGKNGIWLAVLKWDSGLSGIEAQPLKITVRNFHQVSRHVCDHTVFTDFGLTQTVFFNARNKTPENQLIGENHVKGKS